MYQRKKKESVLGAKVCKRIKCQTGTNTKFSLSAMEFFLITKLLSYSFSDFSLPASQFCSCSARKRMSEKNCCNMGSAIAILKNIDKRCSLLLSVHKTRKDKRAFMVPYVKLLYFSVVKSSHTLKNYWI